MTITNITKGTILVEKTLISSTFVGRLVGLLGRASLPVGEGIVLIPCRCVHTFFMRFPIDILFLDRSFRVIWLAEGVKPFRITPVVHEACCVAELPSGTIRDTKTEKGDRLNIEARVHVT
ncbi:MAG: DUF192 domain-containing protein [Firmicutes bacterium]|nr:DUF192 domain-containing protein [Bacillota bacterium]